MNERIKKLRKALGLTQQEFADKISISRGALATYEVGRNEPIDAVISLICREFNVSEDWLRTGEEPMFVEQNRYDEISAFINKALQGKPESFKLRLIFALSRLEENDWKVLERFASYLADNAESAIAPTSASITEMTAEELHAELDRQLLEEKERVEKSQASQNSSFNGARLA